MISIPPRVLYHEGTPQHCTLSPPLTSDELEVRSVRVSAVAGARSIV
jgi:hypothetical protein